jgi:CRISPR-associated protein Cas2
MPKSASAWIVISLIKPEAALRGMLARYFVEIPVHTFAGKIDRRHAELLLENVRATKGKAAIITAKNNDSGFDIELVNHDNHTTVNFDGLTLIAHKRLRIKKSVDFEGGKNPLRNGRLEEEVAPCMRG